jgi:hypothetical protein
MKTIQVNAYEYKELCQDSKFKVKLWLDEIPFEYETDELDKDGKHILKTEYISDWDNDSIQEHCEVNGYLFDESGDCVHHLDISRNKKEAA